MRRRFEVVKSKLGGMKGAGDYAKLVDELKTQFAAGGAFNAARAEDLLKKLEAGTGGQGSAPGKAPEVKMTQATALQWAKLQDMSPLEKNKRPSDGTLCNVEVCLQGAAKSVGGQRNTASGGHPHAEKKWWEAFSPKLLTAVRQGCTVVLFHITRKPCGEGCEAWMKSTVQPAIAGAAGDRTVFIVIRTYQDDDGRRHFYVLTAGALTDAGTW
jgi:hypothetical protein